MIMGTVRTRKVHHCKYCGSEIPAGTCVTYDGGRNYVCHRCNTFVTGFKRKHPNVKHDKLFDTFAHYKQTVLAAQMNGEIAKLISSKVERG